MDTINFKGKEYPEFQSNGNFTRFAEPIEDALLALGYKNVFVGKADLNDSFMAVGEKCK
jgi:hypothetical protein